MGRSQQVPPIPGYPGKSHLLFFLRRKGWEPSPYLFPLPLLRFGFCFEPRPSKDLATIPFVALDRGWTPESLLFYRGRADYFTNGNPPFVVPTKMTALPSFWSSPDLFFFPREGSPLHGAPLVRLFPWGLHICPHSHQRLGFPFWQRCPN